MNVMMVYLLLGIILLGMVTERRSGLSYVIMAIMFVLICFSYDEYDYQVYTNMYISIGLGAESPYEFLFVELMKLGNYLGLDYDEFRMAVSVIIILLINSTAQRYSDKTALVWGFFLIFPGWIITTLFRHMIALSIIIFGLRYIIEDKKGNTIKFFLIVIIASLFHSSYWFFLILLLVKHVTGNKILIISLLFAMATYVLGGNNFLFKIFELLPINDFAVDKYMTNTYSNIFGIFYNLFRQSIIMFSGYFASYMYRKNKNSRDMLNNFQIAFMEKVPSLNNVFIFVLALLYYAPNTNRMYHFIAFVNIIACSISLRLYEDGAANRFACKWGLLLILILLSVLACTIESPTLFEYVLQMHFETNELINMFGK